MVSASAADWKGIECRRGGSPILSGRWHALGILGRFLDELELQAYGVRDDVENRAVRVDGLSELLERT